MSRIPDTAPCSNSRRPGVAAAVACLAMTALVAGCGGGDRVKPFVPSQIIAFGDESSAFDDTTTESVEANRLVQFGNSAVVPYTARYTINVVSNAAFYCINNRPAVVVGTTQTAAPAGCVADADSNLNFAANTFFQSQAGTLSYAMRVTGGIPIAHEVQDGTLINSTTTGTVYQSADYTYYCSMDFGDYFGNWVQVMAHRLGGSRLSLGGAAGCPQDAGNGRSFAQWGAKVADVATQVSNNIGALHDGVLVTMLAGQNDIMDAYQQVQNGTLTSDAANIAMRDKGRELAGVINSIVDTGARVVYLTVPDMGRSPEAVGNPSLATKLTRSFNDGYKGDNEGKESGGLVLLVRNNGHKIVKVDGYTQIQNLGASYGPVAACQSDPSLVKMPDGETLLAAFPSINNVGNESFKAKALLLNCTSNNLRVITPGTSTTPEIRGAFDGYLWADGRRLSPIGHSSLGIYAASRVSDQL